MVAIYKQVERRTDVRTEGNQLRKASGFAVDVDDQLPGITLFVPRCGVEASTGSAKGADVRSDGCGDRHKMTSLRRNYRKWTPYGKNTATDVQAA